MNTALHPEYFRWTLSADELLDRLLSSRNRHTRRLYAADIEHFQCWLSRKHPADTVPLTLTVLLGNGKDSAVSLVEAYSRAMLAAGKSAATVNRHLVTLRAVARIAREMGRIDWDLSSVANVRPDNLNVSSLAGTHEAA